MTKPKVTKTYGPIHFEDLDPHRFEDLVRELIYDYKDWQSIEATGRGGGDEGFDIRAYEKAAIVTQVENDDDREVEEVHPMEGNLWMIQGKREKSIGPKKVKSILGEINKENPPYGYILAASANFSKKSYDVFREELRKKGVMEFYLWGKADLEDMLHLPKNDRILFTFFGISLVSKRRSKATKVRSAISVKNKLFTAVGTGRDLHTSVLIRDLKDTHYPYEDEYNDFDKKPRWREYIACSCHPLGVWFHSHKYYAYIDTEKKEWDFTREVDLVHRQVQFEEDRTNSREKQLRVENIWDFFPRAKKGSLIADGLVHYTDIVVVDDKGDILYNFPHIYVDFTEKNGPFARFRNIMKVGDNKTRFDDSYKKVEIFPSTFPKPKLGKIYKDKMVTFDSATLNEFKKYRVDTLFDSDGKYAFLKPRDIISVANISEETDDKFIQITYKFKAKIKDYIKQHHNNFRARSSIEQQLERKCADNEEINIYEFKSVYKWQFEKR